MGASACVGLPPPTDYIDNVTMFREQIRVGFRVMCIPGILLPVLHITNLSFICLSPELNAGCEQATSSRIKQVAKLFITPPAHGDQELC
jgi:hypothetical protein